jgi:hypothetical protein
LANPPKIEVVPEKSKDKSEKVSEQPENYAGLDPMKSAEQLVQALSKKVEAIRGLPEPTLDRAKEEYRVASNSVERRKMLADEISLSLAA